MALPFFRVKYNRYSSKPLRYLLFSRDRGGFRSSKEDLVELEVDDSFAKKEEKSLQNLLRAKRNILEIILNNKFDLFCTFTFDGSKVDRFDFKSCMKKLTSFFNNYKTRYSPDFIYLIIPEFHKDGAIHFHGLLSGVLKEDLVVPLTIDIRDRATGLLLSVPNTKNYVRWNRYNLGFFSCSRVKNYHACALYVTKYVTKDMARQPLGRRLFYCSQGLERAMLLIDSDDVINLRHVIPNRHREPDFQNDFVTMWDFAASGSFNLNYVNWWADVFAYDSESSNVDLDNVSKSDALYVPMTVRQLSLYNEEFF